MVIVNPAHVKASKELDDNSPTKSDRKDTWVIAQLVLQGRFSEPHLPDGVYAELRGLTQARQQHRTKLNAALNQLQALLDEFFPEYPEVFADLLGQASLYVLQHRPFPPDVLAVTGRTPSGSTGTPPAPIRQDEGLSGHRPRET